MNAEYQVQRSGLVGNNWTTVCRGREAKAREVFRSGRYNAKAELVLRPE
jgi:hypothetical protein